MLFNSWQFLLLYMPIMLGMSLQLRGQWLLRWIALASYVFYALFGETWFLIPMFVTTVLDFYLAPLIARASSPRLRLTLLCISICGNLGLLVYFKYSALLLRTSLKIWSFFGGLGPVPAWMWTYSVFLPPGISFYTFQTLSYVVDVYRGEAPPERNFAKFASFVSFFPHLIAGPLTRHHQLLPPLEKISEKGVTPRWSEGIFLFSIGLIKKALIADRIAILIDPMLGATSLSASTAWGCLLGYSLQIYFDFSGYSDMAIGLGRLLSVELPQNFNSPYQAVSPRDFWRRWHMTLSQWLRDYLYIPLGGSRASQGRVFASLMITMFLGGLWHGAQWTFAIWGLYHGALLVIYRLLKDSWDRWALWAQRALTFLLISIGWIFFRSESFARAVSWCHDLFAFGSALGAWTLEQRKLWMYIVGGLMVVNAFPNASSYKKFDVLPALWQVGLGTLTVVAILFMNYSSNFLYFQF